MSDKIKKLPLWLGLSLLIAGGCKCARPNADTAKLDELLRVIADPLADYRAWETAFTRVSRLKVREKPEFWVRIVNSTDYTSYRRRQCLLEFFRRHIKPGDTLERFWEIKGMENWFNETNLFGASTYETSYLERHPGRSEWMYYPELLKETGATVSFSLSRMLSRTELLNIINHKVESGSDARIEEVAFGEPR